MTKPRALVTALLVCAAFGTAYAAAEPVTVTVTIVDTEGEPIEGARVVVSDAEHKLGIDATSDEDGLATLEDLPAGTLKFTFSADGYVGRQYTLTADLIGDDFRVRLKPKD